MRLAENYIAVGTSQEDGCEPCIVMCTSGFGRVLLPEIIARKLADDLLRNANFLWPVEENNNG